MRIEEQFTDVLQNMEFAIVRVYRSHRDMSDHSVRIVLEAILEDYAAERVPREPRDMHLTDLERMLKEEVKKMCEWRLGRAVVDGAGEGPKPISMEDMALCVKRIIKSIDRWNRLGGRRGYLDFVSQYVV
jgi:hypothetical protein